MVKWINKNWINKNWLNISAATVFLFSIGIVLWLSAVISAPDVSFDSEEVTRLKGEWTAEWQGGTLQVDLPARVKLPAGEKIRFSIVLTEQDVVMNTIMFKVLHNYSRVYLDDRLIGEFGYSQKTPFGNAPYNGYLVARLPDGWQGKTLTIEETGYYDNYSGILNPVYGGTKNALVYHIFKKCAPELIINMAIVILSAFLLISSLLYRWPGIMSQLRAISIFALTAGVWLTLESGGYQLFMGKAPLVSNSIFILFTLIPVEAIHFIRTCRAFREVRFMKALYLLSLINFAVIHILQFTGTADYIQTITGSHIIILLTFGAVLWKFIQMCMGRIKKEDGQFFAACIVFAVFGCVDIIRFYFGNPSENSVIFTQLGLFLFVLIQMICALRTILMDRENSMKKDMMQHMAFTDLLTGLPNRNAFEKRMEGYRNGENHSRPLFILGDLNGLKQINDKLGHKAGDQAIIGTGNIIRKVFPESAVVYRIGGDEFCVISDSLEEARAERYVMECRELLGGLSEELGVKVAASFGIGRENGEGADQAFIAADGMMYRNKEKEKLSSSDVVRNE